MRGYRPLACRRNFLISAGYSSFIIYLTLRLGELTFVLFTFKALPFYPILFLFMTTFFNSILLFDCSLWRCLMRSSSGYNCYLTYFFLIGFVLTFDGWVKEPYKRTDYELCTSKSSLSRFYRSTGTEFTCSGNSRSVCESAPWSSRDCSISVKHCNLLVG